jgi:hypothetical protein
VFPGAAARAFSGEDGDRDWCNAEPLWEGRWLGAESAGGVVAAIAGEDGMEIPAPGFPMTFGGAALMATGIGVARSFLSWRTFQNTPNASAIIEPASNDILILELNLQLRFRPPCHSAFASHFSISVSSTEILFAKPGAADVMPGDFH